jgi:hypothetical protein
MASLGPGRRSRSLRPLQNAAFCPISASVSNFNPQNTQCIPAAKIFAFLELEQKSAFFKGLSFAILDVALLRLRLQNRCGLGLNLNLPFLEGKIR